MLIPNPLLVAYATGGRLVLPVTAARGGLNGYILTGQTGPPCTVEVSADGATWQAVTYPHTLQPGEQLGLTRTDPSATATTITALAPVDEAPEPEPEPELPIGGAFTVGTDAEGFQTIEGAAISTDAEGFQTIENGTATADAEGFETVERTTP
ncbi:hypothetical protein [Deinococcus sp. YIM 77859]|uniref:hypothetical protein n=1 Tax=Deinococcus sp. YIM 77859 TaxID=1540221 RepID=UPI000550DFCF|nr:hypothetical protein [Deinococcus sp. YIM 77859]